MNRTRDYYRKERARHIARKEQIIIKVYHGEAWGEFVGPAHGRLSKGKIHCSCPMCAFSGITMSDKRKLDRMSWEMDLYNRNQETL